ncbi:6-phospho-3-hexuloisomerase [candidate division KSB3 bacterium]|uniref:6-phospho-3-hexuloisomerase n=1 Tax=candidate division KSB3 bacterium TaxID=2044937 RepID=A0A9D5JW07_9BACT|nr:6-phospho-3-hexuloisomerase [candidate division KSB3 bacterium]MBD3324731.1 6-phospho-3-hexuloisomerase [candidate division KSB3 bacterium]
MNTIQNLGQQIIQELDQTLANLDNDPAEALVRTLLDADTSFVAGAGRSGFMVKAFAMRLMHMGREVYVVGETVTPNLTADDLLLIASGSGTTDSLVVMAQKAKALGARLALVTIDPASPIGELADIVLPIPAPSPKVQRKTDFTSIQPMGSLFEQALLLTLDTLILMLMERQGKTSGGMFTRHANLE